MRSFGLFVLVGLCVGGAVAPAWGHGPQIQLTAEAGKIVTRQVMVDDYVPVTAATSIYVLPVAQIPNGWVTQPPGTSGSGPGIAPGVGFVDAASHPFKTGDYTTSIADGLKRWDGANFVDAGTVQLQLYKTINNVLTTAATTDSGPFASITYPLTIDGDETHSGMSFRFLGDGVSAASPLADGVYLLSLKMSATGLTESDPFYFVLPKGVTPAEAGAATRAFAQQQGVPAGAIQAMTAIPEPTTLSMTALALSVACAARRRVRTIEA